MMISVLFLIHDLGNGGAERVLINLVNHLDPKKFDISVISLFGGENEGLLLPRIHYRAVFKKALPGNSKIMKIFSPETLHRFIIKGKYDIEIAYLEGPDSRIISGCKNHNTKKINWVHIELGSRDNASRSFRTIREAEECYKRFDRTICVSETVKKDFTSIYSIHHPCEVLYNTVESDKIMIKSTERAEKLYTEETIRIISVGTLKEAKGFGRLVRVVKRLIDEGKKLHLYILGEGPQREELEEYIRVHNLEDCITLIGFQKNPYSYVSKCDLYVCSSYREGFSTAVTEALIVGTPVVSTCCAGAYELLGENNEYGIVVDNSEEGIYKGMKLMITNKALRNEYAAKAKERGRKFSTEKTVKVVEEMLMSL